ncbi:MAG: EthD domain-containing protein [Phycisphaerales bacterium]|nr:EthD domain-containing protein [Phycisphaerales bacterium]
MNGEELGPIIVFGLLDRRSDLMIDTFRHYWRTTHANEALKLTKFFSAYIQNHRRDEPLPGFEAPCDGIPQLWYPDLETIAALSASDEYLTGAHLDEPNFMEGRSRGVITRPLPGNVQPALHRSEQSIKAIVLVKRAEGLSFQQFADWYEARCGPLIDVADPPDRFLRSLALKPDQEEPLFDAVEEYWWPDMEAFGAGWGAGAHAETAVAKIDPARSAGMLVGEVRVHWPDAGVVFGKT